MMNFVAMGLVVSTLAAAGVWSPPATHQAEPVVRKGRRVIVVEYERELPVSPGDGAVAGVKETHVLSPQALAGDVKDTISDLADKAADTAESGKEELSNAKESTKDKVFGTVKRCKDKLCGAATRVEEGVKDGASCAEHGVEDTVRGAEDTLSSAKESVKDKVFDAASQATETVKGAKDRVSETAKRAEESAKEKASHVQHGAKETVKSAKDKISEAAKNAKESAKERTSRVQHEGKEAVKNVKHKVSDVAEKAEEYAQDAVEKAAQAEEAAKAKAGEVRKNLTDIATRARDVAADAAVYLLGAPREAARSAAAVLHLLGFAAAYGACVWVTFVSSHVLATALPRQQLGMVQSKLYPVYFRAVAYGVGLALAAHLLGRDRSAVAERAQSYNLLGALALVLANMVLLEPKATKVMFERMKVEKEDGRGRDMADIVDQPAVMASRATTTTTTMPTAAAVATLRTPAAVDGIAAKTASTDQEMAKSRVVSLSKRLKKLNSYSSLCNVLALMSLTWHVVHLACRLQMSSAC